MVISNFFLLPLKLWSLTNDCKSKSTCIPIYFLKTWMGNNSTVHPCPRSPKLVYFSSCHTHMLLDLKHSSFARPIWSCSPQPSSPKARYQLCYIHVQRYCLVLACSPLASAPSTILTLPQFPVDNSNNSVVHPYPRCQTLVYFSSSCTYLLLYSSFARPVWSFSSPNPALPKSKVSVLLYTC